MLLGRTFYGFGGESINVATSTLNSIWFGDSGSGGELALAFGINLAVSRMGSVVNNWISPSVANGVSTPVAVWVGVGMNFVSVLAIGVVIYLTYWGERLCRRTSSSAYGAYGGGVIGGEAMGNSIDSLTAALLSDYRQNDESYHPNDESYHQEQDEDTHTNNDGQNYHSSDSNGADLNLHSFESFHEDENDATTTTPTPTPTPSIAKNDNNDNDDDDDDDDKEKEEGTNESQDMEEDGEEEGLIQHEQEQFHDNTADEEAGEEEEETTSQQSSCYCNFFVDVSKFISQFGIMFWLLSASCVVVYGCVLPFNNIASGVLLERNYFIEPIKDCTLKLPNKCSSGTLAPTDGNPSFDSNGDTCDIGSNVQPILPQSVHVDQSSSSSSMNSENWDQTSYQFDNLTSNDVDCGDKFWSEACTKDFCEAQRSATETSGKIMSIPYFLSATLSPFFGHIVDKIGHRALIAMFASIMLVIVHLTLALSSSSPVLPLIGQGLAYTFYAAVICEWFLFGWPFYQLLSSCFLFVFVISTCNLVLNFPFCLHFVPTCIHTNTTQTGPSVPLTVKHDLTGTAFGAITAIQNIGLALFPLLIAAIYTASDDMYIPNVEYFFVGCAVTGTIFGAMLNIYDKRFGGILNKVKRRIVSI